MCFYFFSHWLFSYPLRFARPPNLWGQIHKRIAGFSPSISSSKLGEVPVRAVGSVCFAIGCLVIRHCEAWYKPWQSPAVVFKSNICGVGHKCPLWRHTFGVLWRQAFSLLWRAIKLCSLCHSLTSPYYP